MSLLITRHGQTDWNLKRKVQGKTDIELNTKGIEQAEEVAKKLVNEPIDLIICSPLVRAKQTAEIINRNRNIPIIYDNSISEIDYGEFEGIRDDRYYTDMTLVKMQLLIKDTNLAIKEYWIKDDSLNRDNKWINFIIKKI